MFEIGIFLYFFEKKSAFCPPIFDILYIIINIGVITTITPYGNQVFSYNLERCICDIVRTNNNGIDREQHINKIIRNAFLNNKIDYNILLDYAKKLKCDKKIMNYVEVLM